MIIGATGHQNLPKQAETEIRRELGSLLKRYSPLVGVCSLAEGADQLFASVVLEQQGTLHVIIPSAHYETTFVSADAHEKFKMMLASASRVEQLSNPQPTEEAFFQAGQRVVDLSQLVVAVWDGKAARGLGGTADVVQYAQRVNRETVVIWPAGMTR